jgi:Trypsin-like peptidase domain
MVLMEPEGNDPFTIVGSGFCVDPSGLIVTCEHVLSAFMAKSVKDQIAEVPEDARSKPYLFENVKLRRPYALFYFPGPEPHLLCAAVAAIDQIIARQDYDLGLVRVLPNNNFPEGFPSVSIAEYSDLYEGIEIGTYGFPLGNFLHEQIGTVTSSMTRGSLSSIIPSNFVSKEHVRGFQLNLTATHGNSGGPVFEVQSGKVFGVLTKAVANRAGELISGLTKAEPVYRMLEPKVLDLIREAPRGAMPEAEALEQAFRRET